MPQRHIIYLSRLSLINELPDPSSHQARTILPLQRVPNKQRVMRRVLLVVELDPVDATPLVLEHLARPLRPVRRQDLRLPHAHQHRRSGPERVAQRVDVGIVPRGLDVPSRRVRLRAPLQEGPREDVRVVVPHLLHRRLAHRLERETSRGRDPRRDQDNPPRRGNPDLPAKLAQVPQQRDGDVPARAVSGERHGRGGDSQSPDEVQIRRQRILQRGREGVAPAVAREAVPRREDGVDARVGEERAAQEARRGRERVVAHEGAAVDVHDHLLEARRRGTNCRWWRARPPDAAHWCWGYGGV